MGILKAKAKGKPAFSLIELLVVIAIVGLLAAISMPAYKSYIGRAKVGEIFTMAHEQMRLYQQMQLKGNATVVTNTNLGKYIAQSVLNNSEMSGQTSPSHTVAITLNTNATNGAASIDPALGGVRIIFTPTTPSGTSTDGSTPPTVWVCEFIISTSSNADTASRLLSPGKCAAVTQSNWIVN